MSEYVEARYALLTLEEARDCAEDRATNLLDDLLQHLRPRPSDHSHRADTLAYVRHLALTLHEHRASLSYWDAAYEAAHAWRDDAYL
jgi:hypothetical protein